jgi:hypothetical protein
MNQDKSVAVRSYYDPTTRSFALWYWAESEQEVSGLVHPDREHSPLVAWHGGPSSGYVTLPNWNAGDTGAQLYWSNLSNSSVPARMEEIWTVHSNVPYPVIRLHTSQADYFVQSVVTRFLHGTVAYDLQSSRFEGEDYAFNYDTRPIGNALLNAGTVPSESCALTPASPFE